MTPKGDWAVWRGGKAAGYGEQGWVGFIGKKESGSRCCAALFVSAGVAIFPSAIG